MVNFIQKDQTEEQLLGVVIPVYNGEQYLAESVKSVLNQTCKQVMVVIVNDGSIDNTETIAQNLAANDERVVVINQANAGVAAARNTGIDFCIDKNIKYVTFLDADDVWTDGFYDETVVESLQNERADILQFGNYLANQQLTKGRIYKKDASISVGKEIRVCGDAAWRNIFNVELLKAHKLRFPLGIKVQEDVVFVYVYVCLAQKSISSEKMMTLYRSNPKSVTHSKSNNREKYFQYVLPAWEWANTKLIQYEKTIDADRYKMGKQGCLIMKKVLLSEYIEVACKNGDPLKDIRNAIEESELSYLYKDESIWADEFSITRWIEFQKRPRLVWIKYRVYGICSFLARKLRNMAFVQKRRYPCDLSSVYTTKE